MECRVYYAADRVFLFVAALIDRSHGSVEICGFTRMSFLCPERVSGVLFDQKGGTGVAGELVRMRSEIGEFKNVVEMRFALHYS